MCLSRLIDHEPDLGQWTRGLRLSLELTQQELADLSKVTPEEVNLLENNKPLSSDTKRRILQGLCARRTLNWERLVNC